MRRILLATLLLALLLPVAAARAADNPNDLLIDACRDEKVDGTYSQRTYRRALDELPADSDQYTACRDVITRARLAALERQSRQRSHSRGGGSSGGGSSGGGSGGGSSGGGSSGGGSTSGGGSSGSGSSPVTTALPSDSAGGGGAPALATATPAEQQGVEEATAAGARPVHVGGRLLRPGAVGSLSSDSRTIPASLIALLAALAASALALAGGLTWSHVHARRAR